MSNASALADKDASIRARPGPYDPTPNDPSLAPDASAGPSRPSRASRGSAPKSARPKSSQQPRTTRKQFTACGACQMRQVKCDLKDRAVDVPPGQRASCSACESRGVNCVDTYTLEKPKAQRRGRRILVVERVYGKAGDGEAPNTALISAIANTPSKAPRSPPTSPGALAPNEPTHIPPLQPEFLESPFYRSFHTQRPIIDPREFQQRFTASLQGQDLLGPVGSLLANILVTWAASYGIDEYGRDTASSALMNTADNLAAVKARRERVNGMVTELLHLIDQRGLLRRPSWDGVRVLMLILPLTEDVLTPIDRLSMYQSTISQIYNLCTVGTSLYKSGLGPTADRMVIARIFWYAYVHEGITSGLRGRKLIFDDDDLRVFEANLPNSEHSNDPRARMSGALTFRPVSDAFAFRFATAPIRLSAACRQINAALTGPRASLRKEIDEQRLKDSWERLAQCWGEFEGLRQELQATAHPLMKMDDFERFICGWQIFLFECHNVIRETLKEKLIEYNMSQRANPTRIFNVEGIDDDAQQHRLPADMNSSSSASQRLHALAESFCRELHPRVMQLIRQQLDSPTFFQFDASLVRDGTFYAGNWAATNNRNWEDVNTCILALEKMRWAFSDGETRIETLRFAWNNRRIQHEQHQARQEGRRPSTEGFVPITFQPQLFIPQMHLPAGPGPVPGMGHDAFEHYIHRGAVPVGSVTAAPLDDPLFQFPSTFERSDPKPAPPPVPAGPPAGSSPSSSTSSEYSSGVQYLAPLQINPAPQGVYLTPTSAAFPPMTMPSSDSSSSARPGHSSVSPHHPGIAEALGFVDTQHISVPPGHGHHVIGASQDDLDIPSSSVSHHPAARRFSVFEPSVSAYDHNAPPHPFVVATDDVHHLVSNSGYGMPTHVVQSSADSHSHSEHEDSYLFHHHLRVHHQLHQKPQQPHPSHHHQQHMYSAGMNAGAGAVFHDNGMYGHHSHLSHSRHGHPQEVNATRFPPEFDFSAWSAGEKSSP